MAHVIEARLLRQLFSHGDHLTEARIQLGATLSLFLQSLFSLEILVSLSFRQDS